MGIVGGFRCSCRAAFKGDVCSTDVDECVEHGYCGGYACTNNVGGYECDCPAGLTGPQCDTGIDECASTVNPCYGNGRCVNVRQRSYTCQCVDGYDPESLCALRLSACESRSAAAAAPGAADTNRRSTATSVVILVVIIAQIAGIVGLAWHVISNSTDTSSTLDANQV